MRDRERLRGGFDGVAETYDRVRPGYNEALFDELFEIGGFKDPPCVLEVGCGTGQASPALARRSQELVCVELGANMAAVARRNLQDQPNASVEVAPFESWDPRDRNFDLVFSATAWHWIDPELGFAKAASLLRPRGLIAIVTVAHVFPDGYDPFFREMQDCYVAISDGRGAWQLRPPEEIEDDSDAIRASGWFEDVRVSRSVWTAEYTAAEYVDLLSTYSDHIAMPEANRNFLFSEIKKRIAQRQCGTVTKHCLTLLHTARVRKR